MEPEHLRFDQRRKMYTKGDCWQGKTVIVFPTVGLDVSHVICGVMCRLGERVSMTDGSTMQTSFQCAIADKKGFLSISSDRGGGGLSMHVQPTTWVALLVGVFSLKFPCTIPPR